MCLRPRMYVISSIIPVARCRQSVATDRRWMMERINSEVCHCQMGLLACASGIALVIFGAAFALLG